MLGHGAELGRIYFAARFSPTARHLLPLPGISWWMPPNGSVHGFRLDSLLGINLFLVCGFFLLAHLLIVLSLLRRHARNSQPRLILIFEIVPLVLIGGIFLWMSLSSQALWAHSRFTGASPEAMQVEAVGVQFQWYFRYPGADAAFGKVRPELVDAPGGNPLGIDPVDPDGKDDVVSSELVLPAGREVDLRIRSQDVIHGFFIPGMRLKQDAIPGMVLHVHFTPEREGQYPILCSQLCGLGHARMHALLRVVSKRDFVDWLNRREAARLAQESGQ